MYNIPILVCCQYEILIFDEIFLLVMWGDGFWCIFWGFLHSDKEYRFLNDQKGEQRQRYIIQNMETVYYTRFFALFSSCNECEKIMYYPIHQKDLKNRGYIKTFVTFLSRCRGLVWFISSHTTKNQLLKT